MKYKSYYYTNISYLVINIWKFKNIKFLAQIKPSVTDDNVIIAR